MIALTSQYDLSADRDDHARQDRRRLEPDRHHRSRRTAALLVFVDRHRAAVADPSGWSGLRGVKRCAAMASPRHVARIARTPHRTHRPVAGAVVVAGRAARRWHPHPTAISLDQIADEVVRGSRHDADRPQRRFTRNHRHHAFGDGMMEPVTDRGSDGPIPQTQESRTFPVHG